MQVTKEGPPMPHSEELLPCDEVLTSVGNSLQPSKHSFFRIQHFCQKTIASAATGAGTAKE